MSDSLWPHSLKYARLLHPWNSPGKNARVVCHALLQGIFPTQGSNPCFLCLLHWQAGSLPLVPPGRPHAFLNYFRFKRKACFDAVLSKHPTLAFSHRVQKSVLYFCVSFSDLHIGLSLPFLSKFHIYVLVYCIILYPSGLLHSV